MTPYDKHNEATWHEPGAQPDTPDRRLCISFLGIRMGQRQVLTVYAFSVLSWLLEGEVLGCIKWVSIYINVG